MTHLFGIQPLNQGGGASHVGKEHADALALAVSRGTGLQGGLFGEYTFGKVGIRVEFSRVRSREICRFYSRRSSSS
jgi:hypothetical protein